VRDELLDPGPADGEDAVEETGLRPRTLAEFVGQSELKEHLEIILEAARRRGQAADHLLFAGPPGLGKTTLAGIIANELGVRMHVTSGPAIERAGDLAALLSNLEDGDVLFVDEIHRLSRAVEEVLYPAMEDFQLDIVLGKGPAAAARVPGLRTVLVTGPRIDPASIAAPAGVDVRAYVPGLHRHLAASDVAVVQGGLTTCMELTASQRPFLYVPLRDHFEQQLHVHHRLCAHDAGRRLDYDEAADPDGLAAAIADEVRRDVRYREVDPDGAARAAALIADLL